MQKLMRFGIWVLLILVAIGIGYGPLKIESKLFGMTVQLVMWAGFILMIRDVSFSEIITECADNIRGIGSGNAYADSNFNQ